MTRTALPVLLNAIRHTAHPLQGAARDYDPLLDLIGDARFVLLGEASHGTHEFYRERAEITRRLIEEKGFTSVAVEADWPDAYRVNRYVQGDGDDQDAEEALSGFKRFPQWMWRNADILDFVGWLGDYNEENPHRFPPVGFYGLDLYSMYTSMGEVIRYLERADPEAARRARVRYGCFDHFGEEAQNYGLWAGSGAIEPCEDEVVRQLREPQQNAARYVTPGGRTAEDAYFYAEQNARLVKSAEQYYRTMFRAEVSSWNLRDTYMAETLDALCAHLGRQVGRAKVVVWAHNSHVGDARATELSSRGERNLGQLVRERYGQEAALVGFSTYTGTVTAASAWGGEAERKTVREALPESYEALFHATGLPRFLLPLRDLGEAAGGLTEPRLTRAIGVIYAPETERASHYFSARLPAQFDAVLHFDRTRAVEPLERTPAWEVGELPETFPSAW